MIETVNNVIGNEVVGKVFTNGKHISSTEDFWFWFKEGVRINIFDIFKVKRKISENKFTYTYGMVENMFQESDSKSILTDYISNDFGDPGSKSQSDRIIMNYAHARIIYSQDDDYTPVSTNDEIQLCTKEEIQTALGMDKTEDPIVCGYIEMYKGTVVNKNSKMLNIPVVIEKKFLVGPEGAHLNIAGISGLAAKTSYAMFVINNIFHKSDDTAFVIFNVKGSDLMSIDKKAEYKDEVKKEVEKVYKDLGLDTETIGNVHYYAPYSKNKNDVNMKYYRYEYQKDFHCLNYFLSEDTDNTDTIYSVIKEIEKSLTEKKGLFANLKNWSELENKLKYYGSKSNEELKGSTSIHAVSFQKFLRVYNTVINDIGIFDDETSDGCRLADEIAALEANHTMVVDVSSAELSSNLQTVIFGETLDTIYKIRSGKEKSTAKNPPKKIVIFIDELNKYASYEFRDNPILKTVLDITERGRSMSAVLIGAEQFRSGVHNRVLGNCATDLFGRTKAAETSSKDYSAFPDAYKTIIQNLKPGEYILTNAMLNTPIKIKFPMPIYVQPK
jgi:DNA helicase HerA-like ATPase